MRTPELSVVMPVHNEQAAICAVVTEWTAELDRMAMDYELLVYDDGSVDDTAALLRALVDTTPRLRVRTHANRGHGATVLRGYREARGEWIFQTDSDGEMPAAAFPLIWTRRDDADLLLGFRDGRRASVGRRLLSRLVRLLVRMLFAARLRDVNSPFRLMRRSAITPMLSVLPDDCFAPNVAISGLAARSGLRIVELPVPHLGRRAGRTSLRGLRLWPALARSLAQTLAVAARARFGASP